MTNIGSVFAKWYIVLNNLLTTTNGFVYLFTLLMI